MVQVVIEDNVSGQDYMTVYAKSAPSSYPYSFAGTQDEAAASFDDKASDERWVTEPVKKDYDPAVSYVIKDGSTEESSTGYGHRYPIAIPDGQSEFTQNVVFYSEKSGFTARRIDVNLATMTATCGNAKEDKASLAVSSDVADVNVKATGTIDYEGYIAPSVGNQSQTTIGLSNDWHSTLELTLTDDTYDKAYACTYQTSKTADYDETLGDMVPATEAEYVSVADGGKLAIPVVNDYDASPKTKQLNRNEIKVMMHVNADALYAEAGTWVERTFQLDFTSRTAATLTISGDPLTISGFDYSGDTVNFIKEDGSGFRMYAPQEGTTAVLNGGKVEITYYPKTTSTYTSFFFGTNDAKDGWKQQVELDNGAYKFTLSDEFCGRALPVAIVKEEDHETTPSSQYYLAIPSKHELRAREFAYEGDAIQFIEADGSAFGMFKPQEGTIALLEDGTVKITYYPQKKTVYAGFYMESDINIPEEWANFVEMDADGNFAMTLGDEYCGKAWPVAPVKKTDLSATTSAQYYLAIPAKAILARNLDTAKVAVDKASVTYTGKAITPAVVVMAADGSVVDAANYEVAYTNNTKVGTATVTVTGKELYSGASTATFAITPAKIAVPAGKTLTFNGKKQTGVAAGVGYTVAGNTAKNGGSYTATATLAKNYQWADGTTAAKKVAWKINAAKQTVKAKAKKVALKANKKTKKLVKNQVIKPAVVKKGVSAKTGITYTKVKVNKQAEYFTVAKNGKITVKKGLGKGTYKVTVKATAKATKNYKQAKKNFIVTVTVK